ncbi:unnamed protein product [Echinostoma caproni]|uniref:DEAD domain-containing protein n=1 Tax=Echinostoma caproni TaxID=27848 RepID=A0A183B8Z8_9TREM|nr:unnamed protein product [Echinostoma caproni]
MKMNRENQVQTKLDLTYKVDVAGSPMKLTGVDGLPSKRERRLIAKQRRVHKTSELKKFLSQRGSQSSPIFCVIAPLTSAVPIHLAQLLLRSCDPDAVNVREPSASLQQTTCFHSPLLGKYISLVTTSSDDIFGTLDLIQLADWLILVVPSDCSDLDESAERLMTALYAQGLGNTSFAVLSSSCNLKDLRDSIETRFSIPEDEIHPLNNATQALALLRHICTSHVLAASGKLSKSVESMATMSSHSSARFRAGLLADSISLSGSFIFNGAFYQQDGYLLRTKMPVPTYVVDTVPTQLHMELGRAGLKALGGAACVIVV